ncbi:MAG: adenine-specific methyltransferase EcoRI family protein [Dialister sp.]|nr:adenine-specific methyltransferase EcoRI family protein [Dialister sp.]
MADNSSLGTAKQAKNDEFYTQYNDIEAEMNAYVEYNPDVFRGNIILMYSEGKRSFFLAMIPNGQILRNTLRPISPVLESKS